jgi:hypothetical protein
MVDQKNNSIWLAWLGKVLWVDYSFIPYYYVKNIIDYEPIRTKTEAVKRQYCGPAIVAGIDFGVSDASGGNKNLTFPYYQLQLANKEVNIENKVYSIIRPIRRDPTDNIWLNRYIFLELLKNNGEKEKVKGNEC